MRILIVTLSIFLTGVIHSQINFFEEYSGDGNDFGQGIVQLPDSSYVITGASSSFSAFQTDAFLLCLDSLGMYKWSTYFGGEESDWGRRVLYVENEGFYVAGHSNSPPADNFDFYLVKTGLDGIPEWQKNFGGNGWEKVFDAALTSDTGVIMVGETTSNPTFDKDIWIVRTNSMGDTLWTKTIGTQGDDYATSVESWNDTIFVIAGQLQVQDSSMHKGFVYVVHEDGTFLWMDTIGVSGNYMFNDIFIKDDTLQGVGGHRIDENDDWDTWRLSYLLLPKTVFYDINEHNGGNYIAEGICEYPWDGTRIMPHSRRGDDTYPIGEDLHFAKQNSYMFTMNSNTVWVARDRQDELGQIIPTSDGGVIAVGYTSTRINVPSNWVFALKIGPNDAFPWQDEVGPVLPLVGQKEMNLLAGISFYPNPVSDVLTIRSENINGLKGKVSDLSGKLILQFTVFDETKLSMSSLNSGIYLVVLEDENTGATYSERIVKH
jgi:hypothetical protein